MATVVAINPKEHRVALYDSETLDSLVTEKVVDVTEDLPEANRERTVFLYTRAKRGPIVQIAHPYHGEVYMGAHTHFFIDELRDYVAPRDDTFGCLAKRAGISRARLLKLVTEHAPAQS